MVNEFGIEPGRAAADIDAFLEALQAHGLLAE
jgi:hypothetical protein